MKSEFNSLVNENAWKLVERPKHKKNFGCKWLLKLNIKKMELSRNSK